MVRIHRFCAVRPERAQASRIASVPYDVVNAEEVRAIIEKNPFSFLRISRSDAELPDVFPYDGQVYARARATFEDLLQRGVFVKDALPSYYLYQVEHEGCTYTGIVCCVDTGDYVNGVIRRHELTRYEKEEDRTRHIDTVNAHTGMVFMVYRDPEGYNRFIESIVQQATLEAQVVWGNGAVHRVYRITDPAIAASIESRLGTVPCLYIADGHHRAASAVNVACRREAEGRSTPESKRFMAVLFAADRVRIHGYSRLVRDLGCYTPQQLFETLAGQFDIESYSKLDRGIYQIVPLRSEKGLHVFHMYLAGRWYELARPRDPAAGAIDALDVTVLQRLVLERIFSITDPRGDPRLHYMGGVKPLSELERLIDTGEYAVAFAMQPLEVETVLAISDQGQVMPPKSTWFEPKLLSGLLVHMLD
jgi:uncharacterized protein (DUF1015 family)